MTASFILYQAYLEAKKRNISYCNLGGGISSKLEDNLLIFKKSMSNSFSKFYFGFKIYNQNKYDLIKEKFKKNNLKNFQLHKNKILSYRYDQIN